MAAVDDDEHALVEVVLPERGQLAKRWEADPIIRQHMRTHQKLLAWPSQVTIGVASQAALVLNRFVIFHLLEEWTAVCPKPKSVPIHWVKDEAFSFEIVQHLLSSLGLRLLEACFPD